jgi:hypothetical protein
MVFVAAWAATPGSKGLDFLFARNIISRKKESIFAIGLFFACRYIILGFCSMGLVIDGEIGSQPGPSMTLRLVSILYEIGKDIQIAGFAPIPSIAMDFFNKSYGR